MNTASRNTQLLSAAELLVEARRTAHPIADLPAGSKSHRLRRRILCRTQSPRALHPEGDTGPRSWKVGAPSPDATPLFAPMTSSWIWDDGAVLTESRHRLRGLEAEISFLIGQDLPPRATPYSREEVVAAIASCHPAIEELESGLAEPKKVAKFNMIADLQMHGGFVHGPAVSGWEQIDFAKESVSIAIDGTVQMERTASNSAGTDTQLRLVLHMANEASARTGGLKRGSWITTGSWTGNTFASAGSPVNVHFSTAGDVSLRFA